MDPVEQRKVDTLDVMIYGDVHAMARAAANEAAAIIATAVADRGVAHAMFATGNSQLAFVEQLVERTSGVPWSATVIFHMDEYIGIGPDHPASFQRWIHQRIAERAHPQAVHFVDGLAEPDGECERYAGLLRTYPLDLCCLGIGRTAIWPSTTPRLPTSTTPST